MKESGMFGKTDLMEGQGHGERLDSYQRQCNVQPVLVRIAPPPGLHVAHSHLIRC